VHWARIQAIGGNRSTPFSSGELGAHWARIQFPPQGGILSRVYIRHVETG